MAKLGAKKKLAIILPIVSVLLAAGVAGSVIVWLVFFRKVDIAPLEDKGYATVCFEAPSDGSLPTDHTGIENIGYMNWRLQQEPFWYSEMHGGVSNSAAPQVVETYKQFHDGVLVSADISTSSLLNTATQFCVADGVVLWREEGDAGKFNGMNTAWPDVVPAGMEISEYKVNRGFPPTEFSVYVINENTVLDCTDVTDNGDGTYTQTFHLNPAQSPDENCAVYYYRQQMAVTGGLAGLPQYDYVTVTYTFDSEWRVLALDSEEMYVADKGIKATCTGTGHTEYTYGNEELATNDVYDSYFKDYVGNFAAPEEDKPLTVADCLAEAFSPLLEGEANLSVDLTADGAAAHGLVTLDIGNTDIRADVGNLKLYVRKEDGNNILYISYGGGLKASLDLSAFQGGAAAASDEGEDPIAALVTELGAGEFTLSEDGAHASLDSTLDIGKLLGGLSGGDTDWGKILGDGDEGLKARLIFTFDIGDGKEVTLGSVKAEVASLLGAGVEAELRMTEDKVPALSAAEAAGYTAVDAGGIAALAASDCLRAEIGYTGGGITATGAADIRIKDGFALDLGVEITSALKNSVDKSVDAVYDGENVYLSLASKGSAPAMFRLSKKDVLALFSEDGGSGADGIVSTLVSLVEKIGLGNILSKLITDENFASAFALSADGTITIDGDALIKAFKPESKIKPGKITVTTGGGQIGLSVLGLNARITGDGKYEADVSEYAGAPDAAEIASKIAEIVRGKGLSVKGSASLNAFGAELSLDIKRLSLGWENGLQAFLSGEISVGGSEKTVTLAYGDGGAKLSYDGVGATADPDGLSRLIGSAEKVYYAATGKQAGGDDGQDNGGSLSDIFSLPEILAALEISGGDGGTTIKIGGITVTITCPAEGGVSLSLGYSGNKISLSAENVQIDGYADPLTPEGYEDIKWFAADSLVPLLDGAAEAVKAGGVTARGEIALDIGGFALKIDVKNLSVSFAEGLDVKLAATISLPAGKDGDGNAKYAQKDVYLSYGNGVAGIAYDGTGITASSEGLAGLLESFGKLYSAVAAEVNGAAGEQKLPAELPLGSIAGLIRGNKNDDEDDGGLVAKIEKLIGGLSFEKGANGNLAVAYKGLSLELINVAADGTALLTVKPVYKGEKFSLTGDVTVESYDPAGASAPAGTQYFTGAEKISALLEALVPAVQSGGISLTGEVSAAIGDTLVGVAIDNIGIRWREGSGAKAVYKPYVFMHASLTVSGTGAKSVPSSRDIYIEYADGVLSLVYDNVLIKSDLDGFGEVYDEIAGLIPVEGGLPAFAEIKEGLGSLFGGGSGDKAGEKSGGLQNIGKLLEKLTLSRNGAGNLALTFGDVQAELDGGKDAVLPLTLNLKIGKAEISLKNADLGAFAACKLPSGTVELSADDVFPLVGTISDIVENGGLGLSGRARLSIAGEEITADIVDFSIDWSAGLEFSLDARVTVGSSRHDIYAHYKDDILNVAYGSAESGAGVQLNLANVKTAEGGTEPSDDVKTLTAALVALYNRIADVVNTIATDTSSADGRILQPAKDIEELKARFKELGLSAGEGSSVLDGVSEIVSAVKELSPDSIWKLITSVDFGAVASSETQRGIIRISFSGFNVDIYRDKETGAVGAELSTSSFAVGIEDIRLRTSPDVLPAENFMPEKPLTAADAAEALDFIGGAVELLAKDRFTVDLSGKVTSTEAKYAGKEGVKYNFNGKFEYVQGSDYPVHLEISQGGDGEKSYNLWISPDMYAHIAVNMISTLPEEDSVLFDIYIFDGDPEVSGGKTTGAALSSDGKLDVYMSIGRIAQQYTDENGLEVVSQPAKIYAPVEEIMTVASAAVAMLDLGSVKTGGEGIDPTVAEAVNGIIGKVASVADQMLVDKYLHNSKDRFSSLGSSILESFMGGNLSEKLNGFLAGLGNAAEGSPEVKEGGSEKLTSNRARLGGIEGLEISTAEGVTELKAVAGGAAVKLSKDGESRITGLTLDRAKIKDGKSETYGDDGVAVTENYTETLENFVTSIGYGEVTKAASLEGYYDLRGIDTLLESLVNSATHAVDESENGKAYDINKEYFISGSLSLKISGVLDHTIKIDGLLVRTDGDNNISLDAKISYEGAKGLGILTAVLGDSEVYMSVKNGMIYLKRVQTSDFNGGRFHTDKQSITPIITYRAMPLETFSADIMNQLFFVLNINEGLVNQIMGMVGSSGSQTEQLTPKQDYGTQLADYLQSFSSTETAESAVWDVALNGAGINRLAGMDGLLGDGFKVTFNASAQEGAEKLYSINSLGINGTLLKAFTVSGNFDWQNAANVYREGAEDVRNAVVAASPAAEMEKWIGVDGAYTFEDIKSKIMWDDLATEVKTDTGSETPNTESVTAAPASYLEVTFSDTTDFAHCTSDVRLADLEYYVQNEPHSGQKTLLSSQTIFYRNTDNKICTYGASEKPDLTPFAREHYDLVWGDIVKDGGKWSEVAGYKPLGYSVTFSSVHEIGGWDDMGEYWSRAYTHTYGDILDFDFGYEIRTGEIWYRISGIVCNGMTYTQDTVSELVIGGDSTVEVLWEEIPHSPLTIESDRQIEGFAEENGKWVKTFEVENGVDIDLAALVGDIADSGDYTFGGFKNADGEKTETARIESAAVYSVIWIEPQITVNYYSALQTDGFVMTEAEGYESAYVSTATYSGGNFTASVPSAEGYTFIGWFYKSESGWIKVSDVKADIPGTEKFTKAVDLHAVWYSYSISGFEVAHRSEKLINHYYDFSEITVTASVTGNSDLLNDISFDSVAIYCLAKKDNSYESATKQAWSGDGSTGKFSQSIETRGNTKTLTATFDANEFKADGKTKKSQVIATAEFSVTLGGAAIVTHSQNSYPILAEGTIKN